MPARAVNLPNNLPLFSDRLSPEQVQPKATLGLTFRDSKKLPVHGWYPYVEGFSARYIENLVRAHGANGIVYDPFGGSGTVNLISSIMGVPSAFSESNPFMRFVAETKINARHEARIQFSDFEQCALRFRKWAHSVEFDKAVRKQDLSEYAMAFEGRDFFSEIDIRELLTLRDAARVIGSCNQSFRDLLLLSVASVTVACSHMTRRADLRRRRPDEYVGRIVNVRNAVLEKLSCIERDIQLAPIHHAPGIFASSDCREHIKELHGEVSLVLTSPPYLNGTNYIRNTKLELWLMGFINSERELSGLNKTCMVCGINNVIKGRSAEHRFDAVEKVAAELDRVSPDMRIPGLVRGYFSDMLLMFRNSASYLRSGGRLVLDIGDSRFYGVHVPTDKLLVKVAAAAGFQLVEERLLARRHSRDKTPLRQVELMFVHAC